MSREGPKEPALERIGKTNNKELQLSNANLKVHNNGRAFDSLRCNVKVTAGKWFYEVTVHTDGLMQIGWCTDGFTPNPSAGNGVGDDDHSWGYDGQRVSKWHGGSSVSYGARWSANDVIGCAVDIGEATICFYRNGSDLGTAFTGVAAGTGLRPAISLSNKQSATFNFGKSPFAHPLAAYMPLYSNISDADRKRIEALFDKYKLIGRSLSQSSDVDVIKGAGTLQFGEDLGVTEDTDPLLLVIAYKLQAPTLWEFTRDQFVGGFLRLNTTSLDAIRALARGWQKELIGPGADLKSFKPFYHFVFTYLCEEKKILSAEEGKMVWGMLLAPRGWPLYAKWVEFFDTTGQKAIARDLWELLPDFFVQHPADVSKYDPDSAWPVMLDMFVEWLGSNRK